MHYMYHVWMHISSYMNNVALFTYIQVDARIPHTPLCGNTIDAKICANRMWPAFPTLGHLTIYVNQFGNVIPPNQYSSVYEFAKDDRLR